MPKITNEATVARPDTDTTPDDVTTPQIMTPPAPTAGPAAPAGQAATDTTAPDPAPADTATEDRNGPDTAVSVTPPTSSAGRPTPSARTTTRSRSAKPKASDTTGNGTTSRNKTRATATATTSGPAPDADPGGSPAPDATAHGDSHTAPTASPKPLTNGDAAASSVAPERPLRGTRSGTGRLKSGALQGLVEDFLTEHPGEHSPTAVGKAIVRSSGAVANALERMVASGWAIRTCDKPKRYRIAEGSDSGPADVATDHAGTEDGHPVDSAASDGSAAEATPIIHLNGADPDGPIASLPPADADNAPTVGRRTRRRTTAT